MKINVTVYNENMLDRVLENDCINRIYYDMSTTDFTDLEGVVKAAKSASKEIFLVLPHIFKRETANIFIKNLIFIKNAGFTGFLIRNLEELGFLIENQVSGFRVLDYNMYIYNDRALDFFVDMNIDGYTIPLELNKSEIAGMNNTMTKELLVFGYFPTMVSAQCIVKNTNGCMKGTNKASCYNFIKDRKDKMMPYFNNCKWCYNVIYNYNQLNLMDRSDDVEKCRVDSVRLDFAFMDNDEICGIITAAHSAFILAKKLNVEGDFTKGHFLRGVE